ncbi:MAG: LysR family transcriptional regulator [Firmicutes bacterium]|nr:LysR family transcriptional regulator [Bacillota bacterium]
MDINSRAVLEVYSDMSISAAAKRLGTSEKYLADKVRTAEKLAGKKIFENLEEPLRLTHEGKDYIDWLNYVKECQIRTAGYTFDGINVFDSGIKWF